MTVSGILLHPADALFSTLAINLRRHARTGAPELAPGDFCKIEMGDGENPAMTDILEIPLYLFQIIPPA